MQCVDEAKSDLTVATNLMETRLLCGNSQLLQKMLIKTGPKKIWPSAKFYQGKIDEQKCGCYSSQYFKSKYGF